MGKFKDMVTGEVPPVGLTRLFDILMKCRAGLGDDVDLNAALTHYTSDALKMRFAFEGREYTIEIRGGEPCQPKT